MTLRAIAGLAVFNVLLLGVGASLLWGLRAWRCWTDLVRLAGVAYLLGVASLMVVLTLELVGGVPVGLPATLASGAALFVAGVGFGLLRGNPYPRLHPPEWRFPSISVFVALFVGGIVVVFEALFRAGRMAGLASEWDAWAVWVPKATAIYHFGELDAEFLSLLPSMSPSYPPGLPAVHAVAFHSMGSADVVTLHLQYWFYALGFVTAVAGLLAPRARPAIVFPFLLLLLVMPSLATRLLIAYADVPLYYLLAVAVLLLFLWLENRHGWQLAVATVLLSGAILTKREGILLVLCVLLAGFAASLLDRRVVWPRLAVAAVAALAVTLPWRLWFTAKGLPGDGPDAGYFGAVDQFDRLWPSLELVVSTFFDQELWLVAPMLATAAVALAALAGVWKLSAYACVFTGAAFAAATWVIWANSTLPFTKDDAANPIVRLMGAPILALAVLTPLLLERTLSARQTGPRTAPTGAGRWWSRLLLRSRAPWAIVLVAGLLYPGSALLGYSGQTLPGGFPRFPSPADCVVSAGPGDAVRVVIGYADSYREAVALRTRARAAGLATTEVTQDGCGRLRVFVDDIRSVDASRQLIADAKAENLKATIELDPDQ